ncbi:hypothetical protein EV560_115177 [Bosea sp. BK604]|nr:hypothetical protein EV560_115177 [Bosea sp. BK604]
MISSSSAASISDRVRSTSFAASLPGMASSRSRTTAYSCSTWRATVSISTSRPCSRSNACIWRRASASSFSRAASAWVRPCVIAWPSGVVSSTDDRGGFSARDDRERADFALSAFSAFGATEVAPPRLNVGRSSSLSFVAATTTRPSSVRTSRPRDFHFVTALRETPRSRANSACVTSSAAAIACYPPCVTLFRENQPSDGPQSRVTPAPSPPGRTRGFQGAPCYPGPSRGSRPSGR